MLSPAEREARLETAQDLTEHLRWIRGDPRLSAWEDRRPISGGKASQAQLISRDARWPEATCWSRKNVGPQTMQQAA